MTDSLVARVREAIDEAEQNAHRIHWWDCDALMGVGGEYGTCNCPEPDQRRRRCAADRKILDLHASRTDRPEPDAYHLCPVLLEAGQPCLTLLALAEYYEVEA